MYSCRSNSSSMETCSIARIMRIQSLPMHGRNLCSLVFRFLPKLLGLRPCFLKKLGKDGHAHPPVIKTIVSMVPELPQDILMDIFATLEIPDLVRAGSVCSSWYSAYRRLCNLGLCRRSQTPCLLYTSESAGQSAAGLYSLAENKSYTLTLPDPPIRSRYVIGSNHGWIITADDRSELHLLNPVTGDQIALPSVTTIEQVKPIYDDTGAIHKYEYSYYAGIPWDNGCPSPSIFPLSVLRNYLFDKAFLSSDPSNGDYFVVLIHHPKSQLSFARAGDDKWTWLPPHYEYADCLFKDGLLYALNSLGKIHAFDLSGPAVTQKIVLGKMKDLISGNMYIAQAPCGDLFQIWRSHGGDEDVSESELEPEDADVSELELEDEDVSELEPEGEDVSDLEPEDQDGSESHVDITDRVAVFKVDFAAKRVEDISSSCDNVLFLGHNQSLCLSADAYPQLKSNHVYFTDNDSLYLSGWKKSRRDIGVFDLENGTVEEIVSPQLWSNWPAPVWVVPNPRKMNSASQY